jgi:hypothetical protein
MAQTVRIYVARQFLPYQCLLVSFAVERTITLFLDLASFSHVWIIAFGASLRYRRYTNSITTRCPTSGVLPAARGFFLDSAGNCRACL